MCEVDYTRAEHAKPLIESIGVAKDSLERERERETSSEIFIVLIILIIIIVLIVIFVRAMIYRVPL